MNQAQQKLLQAAAEAALAGPLKALYEPTEKLREMAAKGAAFFG